MAGLSVEVWCDFFLLLLLGVCLPLGFVLYLLWFLGEKIKLLFGMSDGVWNRWEFKVRGGDVE